MDNTEDILNPISIMEGEKEDLLEKYRKNPEILKLISICESIAYEDGYNVGFDAGMQKDTLS